MSDANDNHLFAAAPGSTASKPHPRYTLHQVSTEDFCMFSNISHLTQAVVEEGCDDRKPVIFLMP